MAARWIAVGIVAAGLCGAPALAAPKVDALGSVGDVAKDPVTACADLAASPWDPGRNGEGIRDEDIYLDAALAACTAAIAADPQRVELKAWTGRVLLLVGKARDALPLLESASDAGFPLAAYLLSGLYLHGNEAEGVVDYDSDKASALLAQAADGGYLPALLDLAANAEASSPPDYQAAHGYYSRAADLGDGHALYKLGWMAQYGVVAAADLSAARDFYTRATEAGGAEGWYGLGQLIQNGNGGEPDNAGAAAAYEKGAALSEPMSETALAYLYEQGLGVERDYSRSLALLTDAVSQEYSFAKAALSIHYLAGEGVDVDYPRAFNLAYEAANAGVTYAHGIVGYLYQEGLGTNRDLDAAAGAYRTGADGGDTYSAGRIETVEAEISCADLAASPDEALGSHGVALDAIDTAAAIEACQHALALNPDSPGDKTWLARAHLSNRDYDSAMPLLEDGVAGEIPLAMTLAGDLLMAGKGENPDPTKAVGLYQKAAAADFAPAQFALGQAYLTGTGVAQDIAEARHWFAKASEQSYPEAVSALANLTASAGPAEIDLTGFGREDLAY